VPSIESLKFDTTGWQPEDISMESKKWVNPLGELLSLHYIAAPPEVPAHLTDMAALRDAYRHGLAKAGAAMVSCDVFAVGKLDCLMLLFKSPRQPAGMVYVGSVTLPFEDFSFVIKIQCAEGEQTGVRDAMVLDALMQQGVVFFDEETQVLSGWAADPYDPSFTAPLLSNRSDDPIFDGNFPDHPLTHVRAYFDHILSTLWADEEVMVSPRFVGPPAQLRTRDHAQLEAKPWWRFW
jgi:hypothetical protein